MKQTIIILISFIQLFSYTLNLSKGWELKGALQNIDITNNLFQNESVISVWKYNANKWKVYFPGNFSLMNKIELGEYSNIELLSEIKKGEGFWIHTDKNLEINISEGNIKTPYSLTKFQNVLNNAKLQAPLSSYNPNYSVKYGEFSNYYNKFFYLTDDKYITFYMCDEHHRSELRFKDEWQVETNISKTLNVKVKILPSNNVNEFTFLQIHTDSNEEELNKPLLRIVWIKNRKDINNHIWAVIMTNTSSAESAYKYIDLGENLNIFFNIKIEVINSKLSVCFNGSKKVDDFDVSYWNGIKNYFKLGIYLQTNGCAKALFDTIEVN